MINQHNTNIVAINLCLPTILWGSTSHTITVDWWIDASHKNPLLLKGEGFAITSICCSHSNIGRRKIWRRSREKSTHTAINQKYQAFTCKGILYK